MAEPISGRSSSWQTGSDETSSSPETSSADASLAAAASACGAAIARSQRGAAFYDATHPAAQEQRRELSAALHAWQTQARGETVLAAAGNRLLLTGLPDGVEDDLCTGFARALLSRSVVAMRFRAPAVDRDLDALVVCLAESHKRIREAGGVAAVLAAEGVKSVVVTSIDLDRLLAGDSLVEQGPVDPLIAEAFRAVLVERGEEGQLGASIELRLDDVSSPDSLGSLLDELIDGAVPGVAVDPPPVEEDATPSSLAGATAEELAEASCRAYGKITAKANDPEALAEAADVLSHALDRLSPAARFKLLHKLADGGDEEGAEAVGRAVQNPVLLSAIAQVIMGGNQDSPLASSIGRLLESMRPVEEERQQLLEELEGHARAAGRPLDGIFMEELKEKSRKDEFAALEFPFRETRDGLTQSAMLRRSTGAQPEIVAQTFSSLLPQHRFVRSTRLLRAMLQHEPNMQPATLESVRGVLQNSAQHAGLADVGGELIGALWDRVLLDGPRSDAATQLFEVVTSATGRDWVLSLLHGLRGRTGADNGMLLCELLKRVTQAHANEDFKRRLLVALTELDRGVMRESERRVHELNPPFVALLVTRAGQDSAHSALTTAQNAMRASDVEVKAAAVRALGASPSTEVVSFLRRASGADGEPASAAALQGQAITPVELAEIQRTAVEVLGTSRSPLAVPALADLLSTGNALTTTTTAVGRPIYLYAARALTINKTPEARSALEIGKRSRNKAVRMACGAEQ